MSLVHTKAVGDLEATATMVVGEVVLMAVVVDGEVVVVVVAAAVVAVVVEGKKLYGKIYCQ